MGDRTRDIVLFLEVPESRSAAIYYQAARVLNLVPVLVTRFGATGSDIGATDCLHVSSLEADTILSAVDQIGRDRIAGVFAHVDHAVEAAARIAAALDRPHADPELIALCNDKRRLRDFLAQKGLNTVDYHHVETASEAHRAADRLGGPVVVKPLSSSGSDGVRICRTSNQVVLHARRLLKSQPQGILVERFIDAPHYGVAFFDGIPLAVKRFHISQGPFPILCGVDLPAPLSGDRLTELHNFSRSIIEEIGLTSGPAFMELRDSGNKQFIIEINPRIALNSPIELSLIGINIADLCIKFSCELHYDIDLFERHKNNAFCVTRHVLRNFHRISAVKGVEKARKMSGVKSITTNDTHFDRRGPATCTLDRILTVYAGADSMASAQESADRALHSINIVYYKDYRFLIGYFLGAVYKRIINLIIITKFKLGGR